LKCPKCGFDSPDERSWCDLCGEPFRKEKSSIWLDRAAQFVEGLGLKILERGWKSAEGAFDFICREDDALVFLNTQFESSGNLGPSKYVLDPAAKAALLKAAHRYLESKKVVAHKVRFDVLVQTEKAARHHRDILPAK
jgi:putative endonuclease